LIDREGDPVSEVDPAPDWSKVRLWHRQARDAYTENPYAYLEILLEQAEKDTERLENVPSSKHCNPFQLT